MRTLLLLFLAPLLALGACTPAPIVSKPEDTGIRGVVRDASGAPLAGASVFVYRNDRSGLRGPADFAAISDGEGRYLLDMVPGRYYLVARLRTTGSDSGPPRPGDAWALPASNPVVLTQGVIHELDLTLQQVQDQRIVSSTLTTGPFSIRGTLLDPSGAPLAGAMALAYREPDQHRRPDFSATPSAADGSFILYLPDAGPWCLVLRQHTRGQLRRGELHAAFGSEGERCTLTAAEQHDLGTISLAPFGG